MSRLIDRDTRVRKKPMRVLVLGMCRTGTSSMRQALIKLGYTPHHMEVVIGDDPSQLAYWQEALECTFFPDSERQAYLHGKPGYGRAEFDKLLADYDAVTDVPGALFPEQLVNAYPDAKVILTNRNYDSWERSMKETIWPMFGNRLAAFCHTFHLAPYPLNHFITLGHTMFQLHNGKNWGGGPEARAAYERHYEKVRSLVPKENLLEFGPEYRWEPLCAFLGKEVPKEKYPWANDGKVMKKRVDDIYFTLATHAVAWMAVPVGVAWAVYRWRSAISGLAKSTWGRA